MKFLPHVRTTSFRSRNPEANEHLAILVPIVLDYFLEFEIHHGIVLREVVLVLLHNTVHKCVHSRLLDNNVLQEHDRLDNNALLSHKKDGKAEHADEMHIQLR